MTIKPHDQWGSQEIAEHLSRCRDFSRRLDNYANGKPLNEGLEDMRRNEGNLHRKPFDLGVQHVMRGFVLTLLGVGLVLIAVLIAGWL